MVLFTFIVTLPDGRRCIEEFRAKDKLEAYGRIKQMYPDAVSLDMSHE